MFKTSSNFTDSIESEKLEMVENFQLSKIPPESRKISETMRT